MVITSKIGSFSFEPGTSLSEAKSIRDAVVGQYLSPKKEFGSVRTEEDCYSFVINHCPSTYALVPFKVTLHLS